MLWKQFVVSRWVYLLLVDGMRLWNTYSRLFPMVDLIKSQTGAVHKEVAVGEK